MAKEIDVMHRDSTEAADERTAESIRNDIATTRGQITDTVDKLTDRVQETFDWRSYVRRYPIASVGAAAGTGILLSAAFRRRRNPRERIAEALAESVEDATARIRGAMSFLPLAGVRPGGAVKAALVGLLARKAARYVEEHFSSEANSNRRLDDDDRRHVMDTEVGRSETRNIREDEKTHTRRHHGTNQSHS